MKSTTVYNILSKFSRDFKNQSLSEIDGIEWTAEALGFIDAKRIHEERVCFLEVYNHKVKIPRGLINIIQIAKHNDHTHYTAPSPTCQNGRAYTYGATIDRGDSVVTDYSNYLNMQESSTENRPTESEVEATMLNQYLCPGTILTTMSTSLEETSETYVTENCCNPVLDCNGCPISGVNIAYYRPFFDLVYEYNLWGSSSYYQTYYEPVRLSEHSFFNSIVCTENNAQELYASCDHEYKVSGDYLVFNFARGSVAISYNAVPTDEKGYPKVPEGIHYREAIIKYIMYKIQTDKFYNHIDGSATRIEFAKKEWEDSLSLAKMKSLIPQGEDEWENLTASRNYMMPNDKQYYNYFGNFAKNEVRTWNDPNGHNTFAGFRGHSLT